MSSADRRAVEKARRKEEILQAARVVFAEEGWHRATVGAVAQRAEVGKGTVYLYFQSKEAILADLVLEALQQLIARLEHASERCWPLAPELRLRAMADAYVGFAEHSPDFFRLFTAYNSGSFDQGVSSEQRAQLLALSRRALDIVAEVIADGIALGEFSPGDAQETAIVLWAALNGALALPSHSIRGTVVPASAKDLCHVTLELFLRGIAAQGGSARLSVQVPALK